MNCLQLHAHPYQVTKKRNCTITVSDGGRVMVLMHRKDDMCTLCAAQDYTPSPDSKRVGCEYVSSAIGQNDLDRPLVGGSSAEGN